ncbi:MAG: hypothetical protein JWQ21_3998 [Herminiimonas sp.]|nr:hypothetical protein [Herminiimonas sp.]
MLIFSRRCTGGRRSRKIRMQNIVDHHVILLLETGVGDSGHDGELLVRIRQALEKLYQIVHRRDLVELAAQNDGRHRENGH